MEYLNGSGNSSCCDTSCCYKFDVEGCAAGVPYIQLTLVTASTSTIKWMNLNTGDLVDAKPTGFVTGSCAEVPANDQVCYTFGADSYSVYTVNAVTTYFKNGVLLTAAGDITAAAAVIAGATYLNIADCNPAVPEDTATCYSKTVTNPPTPGSDVFAAQSSFPVKQALTGTGTLLETVFTQTYTSGNESDGQYTLRNGANDKGGSTTSWAIAFNFGIGTPVAPYKIYSQKLIGTPGATYSAGYWAKDRAGNIANFQAKVFDGATELATGTSGTMTSTYTNYRTGTFTMPAAGEVMIEIWTLAGGNASGNDPLLDDIGLWTTTAEIPGTVTTTTYTKTVSNGVTTYTDSTGAEVTGAALTALLAAIAAGEYAVVPCATCGCDIEDLLPTGGTDGQVLTIQPDGSFAWETPKAETITTFTPIITTGTKIGTYTNEAGTVVDVYAPTPTALINDDQVLTGDTTTNTTVTLTPTSIPDPLNPGATQVNYVIKAEVKIDGTTITQDPTTKVLSAANQKFDVLTTAQPTPTATGNTTNLNTIFTDTAGNKWAVDSNGDAVMLSAAVFKEAKRWYADPNGSNANTGANEAPKLTAQAAVDATTQAGTTVLNEGTYAAVTMSVQNTALTGASGAYGSLSQIAAVTVTTASGTSNKISDLTITGNLARTGNAPLFVNNTTVSGNVTLAGTAYTEIRDSSIQDGSITVSGASTLYIEDSKIGTSTFSTAGSVIAMRNVTIDATDCVTIGAGVVYSLQDVNGCVNIDPAAVNAEQAAIAGGLTATQAEAAVTANFMHIRMHNADLEASPTQVVTRDPVTGELEYSTLASIVAAAPLHHFETGTATAGMTTITLAKTPVLGATGKVRISRNGVDVTRAFTWAGAVGTYDPASNFGCVWDAGDIWQAEYEAV